MKDTHLVPAVSVIMSVYNGEQTVARAAASILSQSFRELELIICDDASTDGTWERLKALATSDERVCLLRNTQNLGSGASRNRCLTCAKGRYIALMDADDSCASERLERQVAFLDSRPDLGFVGTRGIYDNHERSYWFLRKPEKRDFLMTLPFVHASLLFRREAFDALGGYDESLWLRRAEDYDFLIRAYAGGFRGENLAEALYSIRADSYTQRQTFRERLCECSMKWRGFRRLGLMPVGIPYAIKPLLVGLIPIPLLIRMKARYYNRWEKR